MKLSFSVNPPPAAPVTVLALPSDTIIFPAAAIVLVSIDNPTAIAVEFVVNSFQPSPANTLTTVTAPALLIYSLTV